MAIWTRVPVEHGTLHVRTTIVVVTVTPEQAFLGLGA